MKKRTAQKKIRHSSTTKKNVVPQKTMKASVVTFWQTRVVLPARDLLTRRPHRSFQRTKRRDYVRSLQLPNYWSFTQEVWRVLWHNKKIFGLLMVAYALLTAVLVGIGSQDTYSQLSGVLQSTSRSLFSGGWGEIGKAGLLLVSGISGSYAPQLTESQQIYSGFLFLLSWLTTVWLLRAILAGNSPRLRDGIYNAGSPIISTLIVLLVLIVQLLPVALVAIVYSALVTTDVINNGILAMLFWIVASLLAVLSLYWITSTAIALVVVTLPGMYPWQAIRTAGDLVVGRRFRLLLRLAWLFVAVAFSWVIVVIPVIIFDGWLKSAVPAINWLPIVPVFVLLVTSASIIWSASYIYLLYRKVVEDDADPA